jgi:hypothetical protein
MTTTSLTGRSLQQILDSMAHEIANYGIDAPHIDLHSIVQLARRSGVGSTLVEVILDGSQPPIARTRAFGMLAAALVNTTATESPPALRAVA